MKNYKQQMHQYLLILIINISIFISSYINNCDGFNTTILDCGVRRLILENSIKLQPWQNQKKIVLVL